LLRKCLTIISWVLTRALPATQNVLVFVIMHIYEHDSQNHFSAKNNTNFSNRSITSGNRLLV